MPIHKRKVKSQNKQISTLVLKERLKRVLFLQLNNLNFPLNQTIKYDIPLESISTCIKRRKLKLVLSRHSVRKFYAYYTEIFRPPFLLIFRLSQQYAFQMILNYLPC